MSESEDKNTRCEPARHNLVSSTTLCPATRTVPGPTQVRLARRPARKIAGSTPCHCVQLQGALTRSVCRNFARGGENLKAVGLTCFRPPRRPKQPLKDNLPSSAWPAPSEAWLPGQNEAPFYWLLFSRVTKERPLVLKSYLVAQPGALPLQFLTGRSLRTRRRGLGAR